MASKLLQSSPYEAENQTELSLRQAHDLLRPLLRPPFSLSIPSPSQYLQLNRAIAYGILTEPPQAHAHLTHLHAIVTDGYEVFANLLVRVALELYPRLLQPARVQLIWVCSKLVGVSAIGVENLLLSLLRQISGGDFSQPNLWLAMGLVQVFQGNWDWISSEQLLLTGALFTYLRVLADHCRLLSTPELDALKRLEIEFCVQVLRERFGFCLQIGRDLIRLLQDLLHIPEFSDVWTDLLVNPSVFQVPGFSNVSQIYQSRTSSRYFLLRIAPEMETHLRFLLTHVNWGSQKRYQVWFGKKFLGMPERETIIGDIVRFICCAHHPTNEILQSNVISRWAFIGWLLKCCRKNHTEASAKLALFYDWLFFDERVDNIMNIEPAILLMVNSIPKYVDITQSLLEFLFSLVDNYDINRKDILVRGVLASFDILLKKGVVHSFENLTSCSALPLRLRERLCMFIPNSKLNTTREALTNLHHCLVPLKLSSPSNVEVEPLNLPVPSNVEVVTVNLPSPSDAEVVSLNLPSPSDAQVALLNLPSPSDAEVTPLYLPSPSNIGSGKTLIKDLRLSNCETENESLSKPVEASEQVPSSQVASTPTSSKKRKIDLIDNWAHDLREAVKQSKKQSLGTLKNILFAYATQDSQTLDAAAFTEADCDPEALAFQIMHAFKLNGYEIFSPVKHLIKERDYDDEIQSATALMIQTFIFSPHERMKNMVIYLSEKGYPVGPRLLSYVSRLSDEAHAISGFGNSIGHPNHFNHDHSNSSLSNGHAMIGSENNYDKEIELEKSLLKCHVNGYISFTSGRGEGYPSSSVSASRVDLKLISQLVKDAFVAYRGYLKLYSMKQSSSHVGTFSSMCQPEAYPNNVFSGVKVMDQILVASLFSDLKSCCGLQANRVRSLFRSVFFHFSDLCTAKEELIRLLVDCLEHVDLVATQFDIGLKRFSLFGQDTAIICHLVRNTLSWDFMEQQKFWALLISELAVSKVQVGKIVTELCSDLLDLRENAVVASGLLQLCRCCSPTAELVGTIISLPNSFGDFAAAVLAGWVVSCSLALFDSLAEWLQKLNNEDDGCVLSKPNDSKINSSAITGLMNFLDAEGMKSEHGLSTQSERITDVKTKLANTVVLYDAHMLPNG